jgi:hypothetical protein
VDSIFPNRLVPAGFLDCVFSFIFISLAMAYFLNHPDSDDDDVDVDEFWVDALNGYGGIHDYLHDVDMDHLYFGHESEIMINYVVHDNMITPSVGVSAVRQTETCRGMRHCCTTVALSLSEKVT